MSHSEEIKKLYTTLLDNHKKEFSIQERIFKKSVGNLGFAYLPDESWESKSESKTVNFKKPGHQCAYLFKKAMLHTGLICDVLEDSLKISSITEILGFTEPLNVCSLGSGPGIDIVALLFVLERNFEVKRCKVTLVDCSIEWRKIYRKTLLQLGSKTFSHMNQMVSECFLESEYFRCDLLKFHDLDVQKAIRNADVITMVKFLSSAACKDTRSMVKKICSIMKSGALLFFIDNAGGKFYEVMAEQANRYGLYAVYGPYKHKEYEELLFKVEWAKITSQYNTRVTVAIWKKLDGGDFAVMESAENIPECFSKTHRNKNYIKQVFDEQDDIFTPEACISEAEYCYDRDPPSVVKRLPLQSENDPDPEKDSGWCTLI